MSDLKLLDSSESPPRRRSAN